MSNGISSVLYSQMTADPAAFMPADDDTGNPTLDDATKKTGNNDPGKTKKTAKKGDTGNALTLDSAANYAVGNIALLAISALHVWAEIEKEDLDEDEGFGDHLLGMFVGIADSDKNGEINDEEQSIINTAKGAAGEYLKKIGVKDDDISKLLGEWDNDIAEKVHDYLLENLDDDDSGTLDSVDSFVFDADFELDDDDKATLDDAFGDATLDAVYKKKIAFVNGKKTFKNKRISGRVKLTPKQKLSIKKMQRKAHNPKATMKRLKSMRARKKSGR